MAATSRSPISTDGSPMTHAMSSKLNKHNPFLPKNKRQKSPDEQLKEEYSKLHPCAESIPFGSAIAEEACEAQV